MAQVGREVKSLEPFLVHIVHWKLFRQVFAWFRNNINPKPCSLWLSPDKQPKPEAQRLLCCVLTLNEPGATDFVAHWSFNSHMFPFNNPKLSNFPVKRVKERQGISASSAELQAAATAREAGIAKALARLDARRTASEIRLKGQGAGPRKHRSLVRPDCYSNDANNILKSDEERSEILHFCADVKTLTVPSHLYCWWKHANVDKKRGDFCLIFTFIQNEMYLKLVSDLQEIFLYIVTMMFALAQFGCLCFSTWFIMLVLQMGNYSISLVFISIWNFLL